MGRKRNRRRNHVYLCIAVVMCFTLIGCVAGGDLIEPPKETAPVKSGARPDLVYARSDLVDAQRLLAAGDYQAALRINEMVLKTSAGSPPADEALFNIGLIFADPGNRNKDYQRSISSFKRLLKEFPRSPLAQQALTWSGVLEENVRLKRVSTEAQQENARLKQIIEKSKAVDIQMEEKKREETR